MFSLDTYIAEKARIINDALDRHLPPACERPGKLHEAMRYSVMAGGKRLRPVLCMAAAEAVGGRVENVMMPALAVEALHTYTLIHDDLPCMDDDDLRRGKPTAHKVFGEATALLAGDALLTLAFEWMARATPESPWSASVLAGELAEAAGSRGVIAGQVEDLAAEGREPDADMLSFIHSRKTGVLIRCAVRLGAMTAGASQADLAVFSEYGDKAGTAFQIADDILNATSTPEQLGKPVGSDAARKKLTYVAVHGLSRARADAARLVQEAAEALAPLKGDTRPLAAIARHVAERQR